MRKYLSLSTAHMPCTAPDFGDVRHQETEYGYIVWPRSFSVDVPSWLLPITAEAYRLDATLIEFDADEGIIEGLPTYEW